MVLSGMNRDEHIRQNIEIVSNALPGGMSVNEHEVVAQVRRAYDDILRVRCTGCAYCMPCPSGIDIPAAFKNLNNYHMFSRWESRINHALYLGIRTPEGEPRWTSGCSDCGSCEKKCPQEVPVRRVFEEVQADLEGPLVKAIAKLGRSFMNRGGSSAEESEASPA